MVAKRRQFSLGPFSDLPDPRSDRNQLHPLKSIIFLTICGVICGADTWVEIEYFGKLKRDWLERYVNFPHGIPSHDTLGRVFALLSPDHFEKSFIRWMTDVRTKTDGEVIAIDGKRLRGSYDNNSNKAAIHMVSAWASENSMVIGQLKTEDKSNEITAIPSLLELLDIKGCLVSIDAMGCQREIARVIIEQKGDYLLSVKENQPTLYHQIEKSFEVLEVEDSDEQIDSGHGRVEQRKCEVISNLRWIEVAGEWTGLTSIARITRKRFVKSEGEQSQEIAYYISSSNQGAEKLNTSVRTHWQIENQLHWVLDVAFLEDAARNRIGHSDENMSVIRRIALNLLKMETSKKIGIKAKRKAAGWDSDYLEKVLQY